MERAPQHSTEGSTTPRLPDPPTRRPISATANHEETRVRQGETRKAFDARILDETNRGVKLCYKCGVEKPLSEFSPNKTKKTEPITNANNAPPRA
jgi:hypothetical protein